MPALPAHRRVQGSRWGRTLDVARDPLYRSGYALVANTAGTTVIGVAYWAIAAHLYDRQAVGRASALVAALVYVSSLAQLNLSNTMPRFLPQAGRRARLIRCGYAATLVAGLAVGLAFVTAMPRLSAQWQFLGDSAQFSIVFIGASAVWGVFALQDAALVGLQRSAVVPAENAVYGVVKLLMLLALATIVPATGIFISWVVPLAFVVPAINWLIFSRYLGDRQLASAASTVRLTEIARFTWVDYVGGLVGQASWSLLPLLVLSALGAAVNASFYVAWTIVSGLTLLPSNFATSLLVEGSAAPNRLGELTRGVLARCLLITAAGAAVLWLAAGPILTIYGHGYAAQASLLLGLLAVGTIPDGLLTVVFSLDRLAGRVGRATLTRLALTVAVLAGSWVLLPRLGITGVGYAWLGANVLVACARTPTIIAIARPRTTQSARARHRGLHRQPPAGRHRAAHRRASPATSG